MTKAKLAFVLCRLSCLSCRPVCFFSRLFSFACLLLFACRCLLSGIGTCRLFSAADFLPSSYCLFLPAVRFAFFRLFPFACPLLFACRRFRCPALGPAGFSPRRIFRHRLIVFLFPLSGSFLSVFSLLPVRCCSLVVVFAVRQLGPAGFSPRRIFRQRLIVFSFPSSGSLFSVFFLLPVFPFLVCLFLRRFLYLVFLFCFFLLFFLRFVFSFLQGSGKRS